MADDPDHEKIARARAEYIRDFSEELALMADEIKLTAVARALQTAALLAQNAADKLGAGERRLREATTAVTVSPKKPRSTSDLDALARLIERGDPRDVEEIAARLDQSGERVTAPKKPGDGCRENE